MTTPTTASIPHKPYNGWYNRSTWNVALHLTNDHHTYTLMVEHFTDEEITDANVRFFCHIMYPDMVTPDGDDMSEVNWSEISDMISELYA